MRILALDTATEACSVALLSEDGLIGLSREVGRGHAEEILGMVDAILAQGNVTLGELNAIAASVGPGSFTGVRISVSVAQGLAWGAGLPVLAVTTLEALALQAIRSAEPAAAGGTADVLVCLDARMGEVYWGCFSGTAGDAVVARSSPAVGAAASVVVPFGGCFQGIGRGFGAYPDLKLLPGLRMPPAACEALPDARDMARLGAQRFAAGRGVDPAQLAPVYLRNNVALTEIERAAAARARTPRPVSE